jgi:ABC-type lipoprotein export system ATPase subunit
MVTHDPHAAAIADHIVVLVDGKVVRETPAGEADEVVELMKAVA